MIYFLESVENCHFYRHHTNS